MFYISSKDSYLSKVLLCNFLPNLLMFTCNESDIQLGFLLHYLLTQKFLIGWANKQLEWDLSKENKRQLLKTNTAFFTSFSVQMYGIIL